MTICFSQSVSWPSTHSIDQFEVEPELHSSYMPQEGIDSLPLRRTLSKSGRLRNSVILPCALAPKNLSVLLRVKHVALDFTQDFKGKSGTVPGMRFIGKITSRSTVICGNKHLKRNDKFMVFPFSACWMQNIEQICDNCTTTVSSDINSYKTHLKSPCTGNFVYGISINGGLQDYICVPSPEHSLVRIPESVSVHDCCFLLDIALPLMSFCVDVLIPQMVESPNDRILIILDDIEREANDCLLVIRHLRINPMIFTFTDARVLSQIKGIEETYAKKFNHVLVFSTYSRVFNKSAGFKLNSRSTIAFFRDGIQKTMSDKSNIINRSGISYKDKFLLEELVNTLDSLNRENTAPATSGKPQRPGTPVPHGYVPSRSIDFGMNCLESTASGKSSGSFDIGEESNISKSTSASKPPYSRVSWLHCDNNFHLCSDGLCFHKAQSRCHHTSDINSMISNECQERRVLYTHRLASPVKLNAFLF